MARQIMWAEARVDSHIARLAPIEERPQIGDATVLAVKRASGGPHGEGALSAHPLLGRRVAVTLERREDFKEWRPLRDADLVRLVRGYVLRTGTTAWFELDESSEPPLLLFSRPFPYASDRDEPGVRTMGFASLSALLEHLLKHPGALSEAPSERSTTRTRWLPLLGGGRAQETWLQAIAQGGCPAQERHADKPMTEASAGVCAQCTVGRRTHCFGVALDAGQRYAATAVEHLASASEPPHARHVHYETGDGATTVAALSDGGLEVVLRGEPSAARPMALATCFCAAHEDEDPMETQARRRLRHIREATRTFKLCTEGGWRRVGGPR